MIKKKKKKKMECLHFMESGNLSQKKILFEELGCVIRMDKIVFPYSFLK